MLISTQIENQLRGTKYFIGVFSADELPHVSVFPATMIINTDPADESGEHWVALHLHTGYRVDYFCSFGLPPMIPEIIDYVNRYGRNGKRYSRSTMQNAYGTNCGDFCVCYLKCVAKGVELPEFIRRFTPLPGDNEKRLTCVKSLSR